MTLNTLYQNNNKSSQTPSILIVEDDFAFRNFMIETLNTFDYDISDVEDVNKAVKVLTDRKIDLVVSDVNMPGKSGIELLAEINRKWPEIPVLIITGMPRIESAVECIKLGAFDYISKPFDLVQFSKTIKQALDHSNSVGSISNAKTVHSQNTRTLAGFTVIKTIGEGSMGIVFLAEKENEQRQYALKIVKASLSEERNKKLIARFFNEVEVISKLNHPNIIKIYNHGYAEEEQIPYYVMQYIEGDSLKQHCNSKSKLNLNQKLKIIQKIACALEATHKLGIYHRDIKPDNVLLDTNHNVKLMDFGIAHLPGSNITLTQQALGTPAYISPEAINSPKTDHRSDIYSLGSLSYELLLGKRPFHGDTFFEIAHKIQNERPKHPRKIKSQISESVINILAKMLKKDPNCRYQTVSEIIDDIDQYFSMAGRDKLKLCENESIACGSDWR